MRRLLFALFLALPLIPLSDAFLQARSFLETEKQDELMTKQQFVLETIAGLSEPLLTRPNLSRTELFELGRRIDVLREIESVILLHRSSGNALGVGLQLVYATPGASVPETPSWDEVLSALVEIAEQQAQERLGAIPERLGELGREIVNVVVEGGDATSSLERLDREFRLLYEEGNSRLMDVSRSLQRAVEVPLQRTTDASIVYRAQPVLSFARSRGGEVVGVVLIRVDEGESRPLERAFLLRLGASLLLAFTLFSLGMIVTRWKNAPWNRV